LRLKPEPPSLDVSTTDWDGPFPQFDPITGKSLRVEMWKDDAGVIVVHLDESGLVESSRYNSCNKSAQTGVGNLIWRAKRQWHRWFPEK
jgi:hypothetical protein